ncbi:MAG TPA: hypothetical protein VL172_10390, partial [Kofleriaceae bacterium]|nr:hypothetical protein [Kofleriaceae bacterium]
GGGGARGAGPTADAGPAAAERTPADAGAADLTSIRQLTHGGGCAYSPAFSGSDTLLFDLTRDSHVDLYKVAAAGGEPVQLTSAPTWEWRAAPGPQPGQMVYLVSDPSASAPGGGSIAQIDVASGRSTTLSHVQPASAVSAAGTIYYVRSGTTELRRLRGQVDEIVLTLPDEMGAPELSASPDGSLLAFGSVADPVRSKLCTLTTATAALSCVHTATVASRPAFGIDGRTVYYGSEAGVRRHALDGGADRIEVPGARARGGVSVAADGSALAWSSCTASAPLVEVTAHPPREVAEADTVDPTAGPGGLLAWVHQVEGGGVLMVRRADGTVQQLTSALAGRVAAPAFSPDGKSLAFVLQGTEAGIHVIGVNAAVGAMGASQVTDSAADENPRFLADGRIAFNRWTGGAVAAYLVAPSDGVVHKLGDRARLILAADRNGAGLILASADGAYTYRWDAASGREQRFRVPGPFTAGARDIQISPDGRWMLVQMGHYGHQLYRVRLDAGGSAPELVFQADSGQTVGRAAIDDDGRVYAAPETWAGELYTVRAIRGRRF